MKTLYMRIHPLQPQRGYRAQRRSIYGYLFLETQGWYLAEFSDAQWEYLRNMCNDDSNSESPRVFQIVDEAGKTAIETEERQAKIRALSQSSNGTVDLTTKDLRTEAEPRPARGRADRLAEDSPVADPVEPLEGVAPAGEKRGRGRPRKVTGSVTPVG